MKKIAFFTVHQAPHNTYTFKSIDQEYDLSILYLKEKLAKYDWKTTDYFYPGTSENGVFRYLTVAFRSDFSVVSGWHSYKYLVLIVFLLILRKKFAIYLDMDIASFRKYGFLKKIIFKIVPYIFITGLYGEKFLRRYLKRKHVYNFPYGVKTPVSLDVETLNVARKAAILRGDKIRVFISNRFIARKGYHLIRHLLLELEKLQLKSAFQFTIAGNGPLFVEESKLIHLISSDVKLLGWVNYIDYREHMKQTDIYLHCSDYEPYGIPPVDAYCYGKLNIASSKVYSVYDIQQLGGEVYTFNYRQADDLVTIFINVFINKDQLYNQVKISSLNEKYLFKKQYLSVFKSIL